MIDLDQLRLLIDTGSWAYESLIGQLVEWTPSAPIRNVTATTNINPQDGWVRADATSAAIVLTLETAVGCDGRIHWFNKVDSSTNSVTLTPSGSETIGGETSLVLGAKNDAVILCSNGENWEVMAASGETFEGGEVTPVGGAGISAWARVAADGTILASDGVSSVSRSAEGIYLVNLETAASSDGDDVQMSVVATPATIAGNGGSGAVVFRGFSADSAQSTDSGSQGKSYFYSAVTEKIYVLGSADDVVYVYDPATFGTPTTIALGTGNAIRNAPYGGCMDYEGNYLWISGDNSGPYPLLCIDLATETVTDFGTTNDSIVLGAKGGSIIVHETGSVLKRYTPNVATGSLGSGTTVSGSFTLSTYGGRGCWDSNGHLWVAGPPAPTYAGAMYQVTSTQTFEHLYPTDAISEADPKCCPIFDVIRGAVYVSLAGGSGSSPIAYRYAGWNALGEDDSGQWDQIIPGLIFNGMHHDPVSDILYCEEGQARVHRYFAGSMQRIDTVSVDDSTPDNAEVDYDLLLNCAALYFDDAGYVAASKSSSTYFIKISYEGEEIDFGGSGGSLVSSVLHALTDVVDTDTAKVQLFRSTNPIIRADGEFSVHIMTDQAASGGGGSSATSGTLGEVQLTLNGTNLQLAAYKGNALTFADGVTATISSALTLAPTSLSASTLYYIYATKSGTTVDAIEASTTAYTTTSGIRHKNSDTSRVLVGIARTTSSTAWADSAGQRFVRSWFNDGGSVLRGSRSSATSTSSNWAEVGSGSARAEFLCWESERISLAIDTHVTNDTTSGQVDVSIGIDDDANPITWSSATLYAEGFVDFGGDGSLHSHTLHYETTLSEGYHYATVLLRRPGSTGTAKVNDGHIHGQLHGAP